MTVPLHLTPMTPTDEMQVTQQLGRVPRGVVGIAARTPDGVPEVVATAPRVDHGEPFPTTFYLTHPVLTRLVSRIEAAGEMAAYQERLADPQVKAAYEQAHRTYIAQRDVIGQMAGVGATPEISGVSAGGMPNRVKCLHALVGHALASGPGVNPIGDAVLRRLWAEDTWKQPGWECISDDKEITQ